MGARMPKASRLDVSRPRCRLEARGLVNWLSWRVALAEARELI